MQAFPRRRCEHDDKAESVEDRRCGSTVSACSSGSVCHGERGLGPAVPMDARSLNVAMDYKRMVGDRTRAW